MNLQQNLLNKILKDLSIISLSVPIKNGKAIIREIGEVDYHLNNQYPFYDESKKTDGFVVLTIERQPDGSLYYEWLGDDVNLALLDK